MTMKETAVHHHLAAGGSTVPGAMHPTEPFRTNKSSSALRKKKNGGWEDQEKSEGRKWRANEK